MPESEVKTDRVVGDWQAAIAAIEALYREICGQEACVDISELSPVSTDTPSSCSTVSYTQSVEGIPLRVRVRVLPLPPYVLISAAK